jgi:chromosome partitioning protein
MPAVNLGILHMLGWLKRKAPPVAGEPSRRGEDGPVSGEERLERLLGRLGSDAAGAGEHAAAAVLERQPRPGPVKPPVPPASASATAERRVAADPADAVLAEIYPPATNRGSPADDPEEAVLNEIYPPSAAGAALATPEAEAHDAATVAAEQSAAEAAAVIADIERIVAGDVTPEPGAEAAAAEEAAPPAAAAEMPAEIAAAVVEPAETEEEIEPPASAGAKPARRRAVKKPAQVEHVPSGDSKPPVELTGSFPPMFVIAVASQKGGAGKTTLAAHLAVRAGIAGQGPVVLIDTDPQGSLAEWWHARQDDTPALAVVKPEQLGANLAELRGYGTAVAIIDTPPALTGSIEQVIAMADLIIIPVRPSPHDLRAAGGTVAMAQRAGKPFMFVVNGASPRASITAQAVAALSEHGRVAPVILYQRTEFAASMIDGRTVIEAAASGRSAQEIAELWQCVFAQIAMRAAA